MVESRTTQGTAAVATEHAESPDADSGGSPGGPASRSGAQASPRGSVPGGSRRDGWVFAAAYAVGALVAIVLFASLVTGGNFDFGRRLPYADDFYDVQARRLFDGRWDMPRDVVAVEGYEHDGKLYMYFGPVPAFLRMPVLATTGVEDGALTQEWVVVAFAAGMAALGALGWHIRRLVRGGKPIHRVEACVVLLAALAFGGGSTLLYLGSGPWVYHEAILWGVAFAIAAFAALLAWVQRPRWWVLGLAGLLAVAAIGSRFTVGLGPVAAAGVLAAVTLLGRTSSWARTRVVPHAGLPTDAVTLPFAAGLGVVAALPLVLYAWLNTKKFGTWFGIPFRSQLLNLVQENRLEVLEANDGGLLKLYGIPTALRQYFRPDAIGFRAEFPWIRFPSWKPTVPGHVLYDHLDRTSSLPATMPLLLVLAVVGVVAAVASRPRKETPNLSALRPLLLGAAVAPVPTLMFLFLTQRYTGDFLPLLMTAGFAGLFVTVGWLERRRRAGRVAASVGASLLVLLAAWSVLANYGIARDWQRDKLPPEWGGYAVDDR